MQPQEMLNLWMAHSSFDEKTRAEVRQIAEDEKEVLSRFGSDLAFGTGGLRGVLGAGSNRMNCYTVARASQGLAAYLRSMGGKSVAIAHDSRNGSREFALVSAGVLARNGIVAYCFDRLMPTPILSFATRELNCDAGIVITASHNPAQYNGYKVYGADGCQITDEAAAAITECIQPVNYVEVSWMEEDQARQTGFLKDVPEAVYQKYLAKTLSLRVEEPRTSFSLKMVYTPLNGTGIQPIRDVLTRIGFHGCVEVTKQCIPDGNFPTCLKPNPELPEALHLALETARQERADIVTATDPDCDRIGVAVRDSNGEYQILTGNEIGLLLMEYLIKAHMAKGTLSQDPIVIKTIVTSDLCFAIAKRYGVQVKEVLTGFKYIGESIGFLEKLGQADRFLLGFEESCGYLAGTHVRDKDGVMACMLVVDMAQYHANQGHTLLDALEELYETYGHMQNSLLSYDIEDTLPMEKMRATMTRLRSHPPEMLGRGIITKVKDYISGLDGLPASDVLSFENNQGDKAIIRPSGTEPKVKVYLFAKGSSRVEASQKLKDMRKQSDSWI